MALTSPIKPMVLVAALLSGCGNDRQPSPFAQVVGGVAKSALGRLTGKSDTQTTAAQAPVTRQALEKYGQPILRTVIPARGADVFLTPKDTKGGIVTWSTSDGITLTLNNGILIQTRGLGPDLMSSQAPSVAELLTPGGTHRRVYYFLGADDQTTRRSYDCRVAIAGKETIQILQRNHAVTHIIETCTRPQDTITNEFWVEGKTIRRSRQLISAGAGFAAFERIID